MSTFFERYHPEPQHFGPIWPAGPTLDTPALVQCQACYVMIDRHFISYFHCRFAFSLQIDYKPFAIQKFDTQIEVVVRGWKSVFLRMGGHVEAPCVDISIVSSLISFTRFVPYLPYKSGVISLFYF